jgi:hypothetical protein
MFTLSLCLPLKVACFFLSLITLYLNIFPQKQQLKTRVFKMKSVQQQRKEPQVLEISRLCPETSTKLYVHEFGFCTLVKRGSVYVNILFLSI